MKQAQGLQGEQIWSIYISDSVVAIWGTVQQQHYLFVLILRTSNTRTDNISTDTRTDDIGTDITDISYVQDGERWNTNHASDLII
jgi:hypothetical protein